MAAVESYDSFFQLYTSLYLAYSKFYGGLTVDSLRSSCDSGDCDFGAARVFALDALRESTSESRLRAVHVLSGWRASAEARAVGGVGLRGDSVDMESTQRDICQGGGFDQVRADEVSGVPCSGVRSRDGAVDSGSTSSCLNSLPRGPNYHRNQLSRMKKKAARHVRWRGDQAGSVSGSPVGFFSQCDDHVQVKLRETRAQCLILENERKAVEEQRRIDKLRSPTVIVRDAMALVKEAARCATLSNDSSVARWADSVFSASAESLARSASSSIPSLDSVKSAHDLSVKREKFSFSRFPKNDVESEIVVMGFLTDDRLLTARCKAGRTLGLPDFLGKDVPFKMTQGQIMRLRRAVDVGDGYDI